MAADPKPTTNSRTRGVFLLLLWITLVWFASVGWLVALTWAANALVQWLLGFDAAQLTNSDPSVIAGLWLDSAGYTGQLPQL
jgi:hypothetical protein